MLPRDMSEDSSAQERLKEMARSAMSEAFFDLNAAKGLLLEQLMQDAPALNAMMGGDAVQRRAAEYLHERWNEEYGKLRARSASRERMEPRLRLSSPKSAKNDGHRSRGARGPGAAKRRGPGAADAQIGNAPAAPSPGAAWP